MQTERPYVLSIAGHDPCSGAGLSADLKTFEQLKVYGLSVCTGLTLQTEDNFVSVEWRNENQVEKEVSLLLDFYPIKAVKLGIVPSLSFLKKIVHSVKKRGNNIPIVVDPVWKSSTGFVLNDYQNPFPDLELLQNIDLFTPNDEEINYLAKNQSPEELINEMSQYTHVLLKGGHRIEDKGTDLLFHKGKTTKINAGQNVVYPKHGSGCVLSASIVAFIALGHEMGEACALAKNYTETFLSSNKSLLGFHHV